MKRRVVITVPSFQLDRDYLAKRLVDNGYEVQWNCLDACDDTQRIIRGIRGVDAVAAGGELLNREALREVEDTVKIISRFGAGYDRVDMDYATKAGIAVCNTPGVNSPTTGESAVALMLSVLRSIPRHNRLIRQDKWTVELINQLTGKTVGLVGFGAISKVVATLLQGFSVNILAYDHFRNEEDARRLNVTFVELDELLARSDVVSLHTPLTDETKGMVGKEFLSKMKRSAVLINTSRGKVVVDEDLAYALQNNVIAGAGLDVHSTVPVSSSNPLTRLDNVVMTPHIGGMSPESYEAMLNGCIDNIMDHFAGREFKNLLNPEYKKYVR